MKKNFVVGLLIIILTSFALISFQIGRTPFLSLATLPISGWCIVLSIMFWGTLFGWVPGREKRKTLIRVYRTIYISMYCFASYFTLALSWPFQLHSILQPIQQLGAQSALLLALILVTAAVQVAHHNASKGRIADGDAVPSPQYLAQQLLGLAERLSNGTGASDRQFSLLVRRISGELNNSLPNSFRVRTNPTYLAIVDDVTFLTRTLAESPGDDSSMQESQLAKVQNFLANIEEKSKRVSEEMKQDQGAQD